MHVLKEKNNNNSEAEWMPSGISINLKRLLFRIPPTYLLPKFGVVKTRKFMWKISGLKPWLSSVSLLVDLNYD